jgi:Holliday junction DNA helicase RuvA
MGPLKAVKALTLPIRDLADAIESSDLSCLRNLKGIGERTGQKIIAALRGKVSKFALIRKQDVYDAAPKSDFIRPVLDVLVGQLGHKPGDARRMVTDALKRNDSIDSPEELFDEVYKGEKK